MHVYICVCVCVCVEERHYKTLRLFRFQRSGRYKSKKDILFGRHFIIFFPKINCEIFRKAPELIKLLQKDVFKKKNRFFYKCSSLFNTDLAGKSTLKRHFSTRPKTAL